MLQEQKETMLRLLKSDKNYENRYWILYKDFLDPTDDFTDFCCENLEGKQKYISMIENLLQADATAKIYVEVYGIEEEDNEEFIYADTLIVYSKLPLLEIERIFNESKDIFPSDIGKMKDFSWEKFIVCDNGELIKVENIIDSDCFVYYCWWD